MPRIGPISRRDFIAYLTRLGFRGPIPGAKHSMMVKDTLRLRIPNPHQGDISVSLLSRLLKQAGITKSEWESL